jgi:hypothetical protein
LGFFNKDFSKRSAYDPRTSASEKLLFRQFLSEAGTAKVTPLQFTLSEAGAGSDPRGIKPTGHIDIVKNFLAAINQNRTPLIDGKEGRRSLKAVLDYL